MVFVPGPPLATDARNAKQPGMCELCGGPYKKNDRIATLDDGGICHVSCVHKLLGGR
jgi:hypothetical protein